MEWFRDPDTAPVAAHRSTLIAVTAASTGDSSRSYLLRGPKQSRLIANGPYSVEEFSPDDSKLVMTDDNNRIAILAL